MTLNSAAVASCIALILGSIALGGGIYENLVVDAVWPRNISLIQPNRGGLNRKIFWVLIHPLFELALLASAWLSWNHSAARLWVIVALVGHFSARVWSFAYFIPRALRFEKLAELTPDEMRSATRWIKLSRFRPLLEAVSIAALAMILLYFANVGTSGQALASWATRGG
jgi:hypothetical protein